MTLDSLYRRFGEPLARRDASGIHVSLWWSRNPEGHDELFVHCYDKRTEETFTLCPGSRALAAESFRHPFAAERSLACPIEIGAPASL